MTMSLALNQKKLEETWTGLQEQAGTYEQQGETRTESQLAIQDRLRYLPLWHGRIGRKGGFNQKGKISGLFFQPASRQFRHGAGICDA